jgi:hypothetical protein
MTSAETSAARAAEAPDRPGWTGQLWAGITGTYAAILDHPFIQGLTSGDLPPEAFYYYLAQDEHYVYEFVRAVGLIGVKAPTTDVARVLTRHAASGLAAESTLHQELVTDLGGDRRAGPGPAGPDTWPTQLRARLGVQGGSPRPGRQSCRALDLQQSASTCRASSPSRSTSAGSTPAGPEYAVKWPRSSNSPTRRASPARRSAARARAI